MRFSRTWNRVPWQWILKAQVVMKEFFQILWCYCTIRFGVLVIAYSWNTKLAYAIANCFSNHDFSFNCVYRQPVAFFHSFVDLADSYDNLDKYFGLNIKMLLAMGILVDLNGTKSFRKFGFLSKVPVLTICSVTFALVCAFWQILFIEKDIAIDICANIFSNISCVSKVLILWSN